MKQTRTFVFGILAVASSFVNAQTLTSRSSTLNYFANYGHGGDYTIHAEDSQSWTDLEDASSKSMTYNDSIEGTYLSNAWYASVGIDLNQSYTLAGTVAQFDRVDLALHSSYLATYSGASGVGAGGLSTLPGNQLLLEFTVANSFDYEFLGTLASHSSGTGSHGRVELQKWNGTSWSTFQNAVLNNGVLRTGTVTAGLYRIYTSVEVGSIAQDTATGDVTVMFRNSAVPEPASFALFALVAPLLLRRKNR